MLFPVRRALPGVMLRAGLGVSRQMATARWWETSSAVKLGWAVGGSLLTGAAGLMTFFPLYTHYVEERKIQGIIMGNNIPPSENTPHVDRSEQERQIENLLAGDRPIIIYGNHEVGKTSLLNSVLRGRRGVVYVSMKGPDQAEKVLMDELGAENIRDVKEAMKGAKIELGRRPLVVFDIPRGQRNDSVVMSVSNFAKEWDVDFKFARVVIMVSATGTAMGVHAEGREMRYWVGPLSKKDMESTQVDEFLAKHSGGKAGKHKMEIFELTGGNIGRMKEVAQLLKYQDWQKVKYSLLDDQVKSVLPFFQGEMGPTFQQLANEVAEAPVDIGVDVTDFWARTELSPSRFAEAVRKTDARGIYYNQEAGSYFAASPATHALLKRWVSGCRKKQELIAAS